jgi:transposase-like protein
MACTAHCPHCEQDQTFWLTARTNLHLGEKRKWDCPDCDYGFVRIDETVDTSA